MQQMTPEQFCHLSLHILLPLLGGITSSALTASEQKGWYATKLKRPAWVPQQHIITYIWTGLYVCMGVASWLVWRQGGFAAQSMPLALYLSTLLLQWMWCFVMFRWHRLDISLVLCIVLTALEVQVLLEFARVLGVRAATALMGPVVAWCIFNVLLCYSVFVKNPARKGERDEGMSLTPLIMTPEKADRS